MSAATQAALPFLLCKVSLLPQYPVQLPELAAQRRWSVMPVSLARPSLLRKCLFSSHDMVPLAPACFGQPSLCSLQLLKTHALVIHCKQLCIVW